MSMLKQILELLDQKNEVSKNSSNLSFEKCDPENVFLNQEYPIYGMITKIIDENPNNFIVEINYNMKIKMNLDVNSTPEKTKNKIELLKSRAFETGVFVVEFDKIDSEYNINDIIQENKYPIEGRCTGVILGRSQSIPEDTNNLH